MADSAPDSTPASTSASTLASTPASTPASTLASTPASTPASTRVTIIGYREFEQTAESLVDSVTKSEGIKRDGEFVRQPLGIIENLLWIQENRLHKAALDEWERSVNVYTARVDRFASRIEGLKNEVYQLVGFSSAFQGVVLTAVTQMTQSHNVCKKVWSPVLLIALAWISTLVAVWQKFGRIREIEGAKDDEEITRKGLESRAEDLRTQGRRFKFRSIKTIQESSRTDEWNKLWIHNFAPIAIILSLFAGLFVAACFSILCDRGLAPINDRTPIGPSP